MKNFKEVNFGEFFHDVATLGETLPEEKSFDIMRVWSNRENQMSVDVVNLVLANSETIEEAFVRIQFISRAITNPLVLMRVFGEPGEPIIEPTEESETPALGFITKEEIDILYDGTKLIKSGSIKDFLEAYQKNENASWKGAILLTANLLMQKLSR